MEVTVNGEPLVLGGRETVAELIARLELTPPRIAVEVNARLVRRADYAATSLRHGDRIEIVTLVGGG